MALPGVTSSGAVATSLGTKSSASTTNKPQSQEQQQQQQQPHNNKEQQTSQNNSAAKQASASLQMLWREDRLLQQHELHISTSHSEESSFAYAAALLQQDGSGEDNSNSNSSSSSTQARATEAFAEVDRKLALVESLAERVSRTSPEAVAGPLMSLHGYSIMTTAEPQSQQLPEQQQHEHHSTTTLTSTRERCHRLQRQGEVLEGVARRVETSLQRGLKRMDTATSKLSRVLDLSATLKMILRIQFESSKLQGYDWDDLRDLTRAAASVAVLEDLLARPEFHTSPRIDIVEEMRPEAQRAAAAVRKAAAALLAQHQERSSTGSSSSGGSDVVQLGATLQVYYHLRELPQAAWSAVQHALDKAQIVSQALWSPTAIIQLMEKATLEAKAAVGLKHKPGETERMLKKKLKELRATAASTWSTGITNVASNVWNLHRVLCRKSDPTTRQLFMDVVSASPIPPDFTDFASSPASENNFSVFSTFWNKLCFSIGQDLQLVLDYQDGKLGPDVAGLYPAVRAAALDMLGSLYDTMQAGGGAGAGAGGTSTLDDATASSSIGILGGSAGLDDSFLKWTSSSTTAASTNHNNTHSGNAIGLRRDDSVKGSSSTTTKTTFSVIGMASADTWTRADTSSSSPDGSSSTTTKEFLSSTTTTTTTSSLSAIFQSTEWKTLQGSDGIGGGLLPLKNAFLNASMERLCAPLQYMFPPGITVDEEGIAMPVLPTLPSKYDLQKLDIIIRQELSLADPREGGGELSMTSMVAESIVHMVKQFCQQAAGAVSGAGEDGCLTSTMSPTEALDHDLKVSSVMSALATTLRTAPENTFVVPYRPATSAQHEEAASLCQAALLPALQEIENTAKSLILTPLCRALNRRVADAIAKMHHGTYLSESMGDSMGSDEPGTSFVEKHLSTIYNGIAQNFLSKLPTEFATIVASTVAKYSIYTFVSNVSLIRPLSETGRLHVTQDLADFEFALEQLVFKSNSSKTLNQIDHGKPYAELRDVRQMLFWTGLEDHDQDKAASSIAKLMLREVWIKDVRPSTVFHFLFSFAPPLLSSPHHAKNMKPEEYVKTLVQLDGSIDDGEANAWMITMACCDSYQQRESASSGVGRPQGDRRVPSILMMLGPELLRRRRH